MTATQGSESATRVERRIEDGTIVLEEPLGFIRIEQRPGDVVLSTLRGRHTEALAIAMSNELDTILRRGRPIHNFYDGWLQDGHDTPIRNHWQRWATQNRSHMLSNQMLYQSRNVIATMASTVANLLLGGSLTIHTARSSFEGALRQVSQTRTAPDA